MSADSFIFFSPAQVMQSNPSSFLQPIADNAAGLNNFHDIDFTIYSQENNSSELENDSFPSIDQVQQIDESDLSYTNYAAVNSTNHIPSDHFITSSHISYTPQNQSPFTVTSPHGNSLNDNPLLDFPTNNNLISPHQTPLTTSQHLVVGNDILNSPYSHIDSPLIFSPVINSFQDLQDRVILTPDPGTPYTAYTPLTPYTPLISFNPDLTPHFVPNTPTTPLIDKFDPPLYETESKCNFNLFEEVKPNISELGIGIQGYTYPLFYHPNVSTVKMDFISPIDTGNDKKPEGLVETAVVPGTPNSDGSSSGSASEKSASPLSPAIEHSEHQTETNSASQVGENPDVNTEGARSPSSSANSPVTTPRLVAIRPRPQEDDDDNSEPAIRRSKRPRTRSISENDEENEEDGDEKKYACPDCGRGFNRKFNMQTHRATHDPNRVKPFACEHPNCGSRFTRKHDLKRHVNGIHRGERVHSCTVCNKPFSRKDAWKRHVTTCGKV